MVGCVADDDAAAAVLIDGKRLKGPEIDEVDDGGLELVAPLIDRVNGEGGEPGDSGLSLFRETKCTCLTGRT